MLRSFRTFSFESQHIPTPTVSPPPRLPVSQTLTLPPIPLLHSAPPYCTSSPFPSRHKTALSSLTSSSSSFLPSLSSHPTPHPLPQFNLSNLSIPSTTQHFTMPSQLRLLDLQSEVLDAILSHLHPRGPLRRHAILHPPPSFPLSLTCHRFHSLFRSKLHTIDALYPETYVPLATAAVTKIVSSQHLASLVRLARPYLKVLRLPRDCVDIDKILNQISMNRIYLDELAYSNSNFDLDVQTVGALFTVASSWKRLHIFKPTAAFRFLVLANNLEQLELTGVQPRYLFDLIEALYSIGQKLRVLKLGFQQGIKEEDPPYTMEPGWCMRVFATYLCQYADKQLPRLREFDINALRSDVICHARTAERAGSSWVENVAELEALVGRMRERNGGTGREAGTLRKLAVRTASRYLHPTPAEYLKMFEGIIVGCLEVEVQIVGATVVFPAGGGRSWFKVLQITQSDLEYSLDGWGVDVEKIQILDLGTNAIATMYEADAEFREKVTELVGRCVGSLKEVRVEVEINSAGIMKSACTYLADVLEKAVGVERVYIRTGLVDFAVAGWDEFQRLMQSMGQVRVLRLTIHPWFSPECKMAFARNLSMFLDETSKHCGNLECLFLESAMAVKAASIASSEVREIAMKFYDMCMAAVERFRRSRPNCDISTVRSQLSRWFMDINPDPLLSALMGTWSMLPTQGPWPPGLGPPPVLPPP